MFKLVSIILVFLLSCSALAKDVTYIEKGTPAPYTGQLFTEVKAEEVRKELIEKDQLKIFNEAMRQTIEDQHVIIENKDTEIKLLSEQNEKLVKKVEESGTTSNFEKVLWFGLGIAATSLAIYGASSLVRH